LWRSVVQRERLQAGFAEFSLVGLCTVPLTLVAAVLGLWGGVQAFGL
jgi:arsenical pump membrane protein